MPQIFILADGTRVEYYDSEETMCVNEITSQLPKMPEEELSPEDLCVVDCIWEECPVCGNQMPEDKCEEYKKSEQRRWHRKYLIEAVVKAQAKLIADLDW